MSSTTTETATVEVLTAEVRVLQVGRRQITQSVYRQLDRVDPDDIEPFGRVNAERDVLGVVGRHRHTGALVSSCVQSTRAAVYFQDVPRSDAFFAEWVRLPLIVLAGLR